MSQIQIDPALGRTFFPGDLLSALDIGRGDSTEIIGVYLGDNTVAMYPFSSSATVDNLRGFTTELHSFPDSNRVFTHSGSSTNWTRPSSDLEYERNMDYCKRFVQTELATHVKRINDSLSSLIKTDEISDYNDGVSAALTKLEEVKEELKVDTANAREKLFSDLDNLHKMQTSGTRSRTSTLHTLSSQYDGMVQEGLQELRTAVERGVHHMRSMENSSSYALVMRGLQDNISALCKDLFGDFVEFRSADITRSPSLSYEESVRITIYDKLRDRRHELRFAI